MSSDYGEPITTMDLTDRELNVLGGLRIKMPKEVWTERLYRHEIGMVVVKYRLRNPPLDDRMLDTVTYHLDASNIPKLGGVRV